MVYINGDQFDRVKPVEEYFSGALFEGFKFEEEVSVIGEQNGVYLTGDIGNSNWNLIFQIDGSILSNQNLYVELVLLNMFLLLIALLIFTLLRKNMKLEEEKKKILQEKAEYDDLTGLYSRDKFFELAGMIFNNAQRDNISCALVMFDLDDFKEVNDNYGHLAGDRVLAGVSHIIRENIRESDLAARFGGEEFAVLLTGVNRQEAYAVVEGIRKKIAGTTFSYRKQAINITISAGITTEIQDSFKDMISRADRELYKSKKNGKNQTNIE